MKQIKLLLILAILTGTSGTILAQNAGNYKILVEGFDWGPAVNKVVLEMGETLSEPPTGDFSVHATRTTDLAEIPEAMAAGPRTVLSTYVSDANGNRVAAGSHLTLVLAVGPQMPIGSPFQYAQNEKVRGNFWVDYRVAVTLSLIHISEPTRPY